ncbi:MAG: sterol desaturase family protein [Bacteroidota bacterium]|nr:sterol desaturase family protein [Bacteroidota bacterium]
MGKAIVIVIITFLFMEAFSWFIHKYLMHGVLWRVHKTHHEPGGKIFEKNDLFSLFFGAVAVTLIFLGSETKDYKFWIGIGISLYGFTYFMLHDLLIHRRIKIFKNIKIRYFNALIKAHRDHHKSKGIKSGGSYGLLLVPRKYFKKKIL